MTNYQIRYRYTTTEEAHMGGTREREWVNFTTVNANTPCAAERQAYAALSQDHDNVVISQIMNTETYKVEAEADFASTTLVYKK